MYHLQTQSRVKNPPDFIGRNRRAAKDWGKSGGRNRQAKDQKKQQKKEASDTVEITKTELERLLKMAVSLQSNSMNSATHIKPEPSQIPGLQHQIQDNEEKTHHRTDPQPSEEYYPWGRPGGGAPIRTVSGTLLTNYSTRGQEVERARSNVPQQPSLVHSSPQKPQFARGLGPHVDTFVLSQREEQRRKEQMHKAELAAQIAERQRQREAEKRRREAEEMEAERKVRQELEEINRRNEKEREMRQQKAEEARLWQAELQTRMQEAEESAVREKQRLVQQIRGCMPTSSYEVIEKQTPKPSRIPLPSYRTASQRTFSENSNLNAPMKTTVRAPPPLPYVAMEMSSRPAYHQPRPASPVVPALAKKLGLPAADHQSHVSPHPSTKPMSPPLSHRQTIQPPQPVTLPSLPPPPPPPQHTCTPFPSHHSTTVPRQQQILNQLEILRQGILSQRKSVEQRLKLQRRQF